MPLSDDIRGLTDQVLDRVDEAREFYVHSRQAWRLVQQLVRKGRPVGIVDPATRRHLPTGDLESCSLVGCVKFAQTHHFMNAGASSSTRRTGYRSCPQGLDLTTRDIDIVHVHGSALEGRALEQFGKGTRNAERVGFFLEPVPQGLPPIPGGYFHRAVDLPGSWRVLSPKQPEPHDLAVTKLKRFHAKDRQDLQILCDSDDLDADRLSEALDSAFAWAEKDDPDRERAAANLRRVIDYLEGRTRTL